MTIDDLLKPENFTMASEIIMLILTKNCEYFESDNIEFSQEYKKLGKTGKLKFELK